MGTSIYIIDLMNIADVVFVYEMKSDREINWHGRHHSHGERQYEFHYFLEGEGVYRTEGTSYRIKKGMLYLSAPKTRHRIHAENKRKPISYYAVLFELEPGDEELSRVLDSSYPPMEGIQIGTSYRFFFEQLKERGMCLSTYLRRSAEFQLLSFIYTQAEGGGSHYGDEGNYHIEKTLRIMQNMVFGQLTLGDLADRLQLDPSYLSRLFRKRMHIAPMKYYTKLKVEAASSLLTNTEETVQAIADKLCFSSEFHLSRIFKQYTGYAPTHYRAQFARMIPGI